MLHGLKIDNLGCSAKQMVKSQPKLKTLRSLVPIEIASMYIFPQSNKGPFVWLRKFLALQRTKTAWGTLTPCSQIGCVAVQAHSYPPRELKVIYTSNRIQQKVGRNTCWQEDKINWILYKTKKCARERQSWTIEQQAYLSANIAPILQKSLSWQDYTLKNS